MSRSYHFFDVARRRHDVQTLYGNFFRKCTLTCSIAIEITVRVLRLLARGTINNMACSGIDVAIITIGLCEADRAADRDEVRTEHLSSRLHQSTAGIELRSLDNLYNMLRTTGTLLYV